METLDLNIQFLDALCGRSLIRWDHTPTKNGAPKKILGDFQKLEIFFSPKEWNFSKFFHQNVKNIAPCGGSGLCFNRPRSEMASHRPIGLIFAGNPPC